DAIAMPNWSAQIMAQFEDATIDAVAGTAALTELSPPGRFWARWYFRNFRRWHERSIGISPVMYGFNCAMRKEVWRDIKDGLTLGDASISEDLDVTCSVLKHGYTIRFSPKI